MASRFQVDSHKTTTSHEHHTPGETPHHPQDHPVRATSCNRSLTPGEGLRIGETLGLRREDLHLLPDSRALGCTIAGAHVHVRRRLNDNGALAKSHYPRSVPVGTQTVDAYRDYQYERDRLVPDSGCDFVFVNLYWSTAPDTAMKYPNTRSCLTRVARRAGVQARLHMLRHTAGTAWVRSGTPIDVVQKLMGHQSPVSTAKYLHPPTS
ncbi:MAG: transposase [Comamonadaceae bacterium]|nr:MAG: transposase [Comamonadaceae bacterium]